MDTATKKAAYLRGFDAGIAGLPEDLEEMEKEWTGEIYDLGFDAGQEARRRIEERAGDFIEREIRKATRQAAGIR